MSDIEQSEATVPASITFVGLRQNTKHGLRATLPLLTEPGIFTSHPATDLTHENAHEARFDQEGFVYLSSAHPSLYWSDMVPIEERTSGEIDLHQTRQRDVVQQTDYASHWFSRVDGVEKGLRWICHKIKDEGMYEHPANPYFVLLQQERKSARWTTTRVIKELGLWENWPDLLETEHMPRFMQSFTAVESQEYLETLLKDVRGLSDKNSRLKEHPLQPIRVRPYLSAVSGFNLFYDQSIKPLLQAEELTKAKKQVVRARVRLEEIMNINSDWRIADPSESRRNALRRRVEQARGIPYSQIAA